MNFNRETITDYFKAIKAINDLDDIPENETEIKKLDNKIQHYVNQHDNIPQNEGYIQYLANITVDIYTQKDHQLLKNYLESKGFVSNDFKRPLNEKKYNPKFIALIGSDTEEGLNNMIMEINELCEKNDICFSSGVTINTDESNPMFSQSPNNVIFYNKGESLDILTSARSSILLGSKINDVINFQLSGEYSYVEPYYNISDAKVISFEKPEVKESPKLNFIAKFLDKKVEKEDEANKEYHLNKIITGINDNINRTLIKIKEITNFDIKADPFIHQLEDHNISKLRSVQIENNKLNVILDELTSNNKNILESSEKRKNIILKNGYKI